MANEGSSAAQGKEQGLQQEGPVQPHGQAFPDNRGEPTHTSQGAPTDAAHQEAGDGALTGSAPAGLTTEELRRGSESAKSDDPATE